jgi:hypothetical protein
MFGVVAGLAEKVTLSNLGPEFGEAIAVDHASNFGDLRGGVTVVEMKLLWITGETAARTNLLGLPGFELLVFTGWRGAVFALV